MRQFGELLLALAESMPAVAGGASEGLELDVTGVDLTVPLEAHIGPGGALLACLPRGRLATGFQLPHGRLLARFSASPRGTR